ncbi:cyd operon protein YbgT [Paraburkholderia sp. GAS42]
MWYFSWILGIGVALAFGIINVMWFEARRPVAAAAAAATKHGQDSHTSSRAD